MNAFANVVSTAAHRVIRGVILTRQGLEGKARSTSMVQELVKLLPPDLFRTCLARVRSKAALTSDVFNSRITGARLVQTTRLGIAAVLVQRPQELHHHPGPNGYLQLYLPS